MKRSYRLQVLLSLVLVILIAGDEAGFWPSRLLDRLESIAYDFRVLATLGGDPDPGLIIVDIDERSIAELGQWPWPRRVVAELIDRLFAEQGLVMLGVDVVMSEPEQDTLRSSWALLRENYPQLPEVPPLPGGDEILSEVLGTWPVVLGYYFAGLDSSASAMAENVGQLPKPLQIAGSTGNLVQALDLPWFAAERFNGNLPLLQDAANQFGSGGGFFDNPAVDIDGVFRRAPMIQRYGNDLYPSLPLAMFLELFGNPEIALIVSQGGGVAQLEGLDIGGFVVPTNERGLALVPWYGEERHFRYVSAVDVLTGALPEQELAGAIAILGTSAPGLKDLRSTPVGAVYPGAEINLSFMAGILHQRFLAEPAYARAAGLILTLVLGVAGSLILPHLSALLVLSLALALMITHITVNLWMWNSGYLLAFAPATVMIIGMAVLHLLGNYWRESQRTSWVTSRFGQYVPPELVQELVASGQELSLDGEQRTLTVLFSDVREFTAFSEQVSASKLSEVMNRLLSPLTAAIHEHHGTIDKYMGDAIMAFWGAPLADQEHAHDALAAAADMQRALAEVNKKFMDDGLPALRMGIGIHSGTMNVGNMGSSFRMAYTVLGDNVNLGSRVEGLTKNYGVEVLTTEDTCKLAPQWLFRPVDKVRVKGRQQPVMLYEPLGLKTNITSDQEALAQWCELALKLYWRRNFESSLQQWREVLQRKPGDSVAVLFIQRCERYLQDPPDPAWDGVWSHTLK
jgi:adenylate cyclase